jgi:hypothetical protein
MKKVNLLLCGLAVVFAAASCDKKNTTPEPEPEPEPEVPVPVDLSAEGTANCYFISKAEWYSFNATVKGNGKATEGLEAPEAIAPTGAQLVWETEKGMISNLAFEEGKISFNVSEQKGNALIAAIDDAGTILWSWHIWAPEDSLASVEAKNGYQVANMNLGAMKSEATGDVKPYGMLYQWGRKDPFPASPTVTGDQTTVGAPLYDAEGNEVSIANSSWYDMNNNSIAYSITHPTVCLSNYSQYMTSRDWIAADASNDALWGNPKGSEKDEENNYTNTGAKSYYDPCPVGYRVPPADVFRYFTTSGGYSQDISTYDIADVNGDGVVDTNDYNYGWNFNMKEGSQYFPAAARYDGSYAMLYGSVSGIWGSYWGNCPASSVSSVGTAFCVLSFQKITAGTSTSPNGVASRADAYSVRCIKE